MQKISNAYGCYGQLFLRECGKKVVKVFFNREKEGRTKDDIQAVFEAEVEAYEIAQSNVNTRDLIPAFYGVVNVGSCIDEPSRYYTDFAYELEFLSGHFAPISSPLISPESSSAVIELFYQAGIDVIDSAATYQDQHIKKVVDFTVLSQRT
ncbi:TPA: hypothetical protein N2782_004587, partial [Vibrio parahaemolyticus]|nr:hypothetical protein [Vibrio parahaemolyticus]